MYSIQSQWSKAIKEFKIAVKIEPDNAEYLRGLGWASFNYGDKLKGLEYLHRANVFEPSSVSILLDLSNAYLMVFDFEQTQTYVEKAIQIDPGNSLAQEVAKKIKEFHEIYIRGKGWT